MHSRIGLQATRARGAVRGHPRTASFSESGVLGRAAGRRQREESEGRGTMGRANRGLDLRFGALPPGRIDGGMASAGGAEGALEAVDAGVSRFAGLVGDADPLHPLLRADLDKPGEGTRAHHGGERRADRVEREQRQGQQDPGAEVRSCSQELQHQQAHSGYGGFAVQRLAASGTVIPTTFSM